MVALAHELPMPKNISAQSLRLCDVDCQLNTDHQNQWRVEVVLL